MLSLPELGMLLMATIGSVSGQYFLKQGALKIGKVTASNLVGHILSFATTPELVIGITCYALGAIAYILAMTRIRLSIVGPSLALSYVFSVLLGYYAFHEAIPVHRLFGLGFIMCGVILVVWEKS